jgi:tetratricopeptide (TPR) repeat protein
MRALRLGIVLVCCGAASASISTALPATARADDLAALNERIGLLYRAGRYREAIPPAENALALTERGSDQRALARSLQGLADLYRAQARQVEAEQHYKRALGIRTRELGPDHPAVAQTLNGLADLYRAQGRFEEAEPHYQRALSIRENAPDRNEADVGRSLGGLGDLYRTKGRYDEAEQLLNRAVATLEKTVGPDHPDLAESLNDLAILHRERARYDDAERLYNRALDIRRKALPPGHPDVAQSLGNLAVFHYVRGDYKQAKPLFEESLRIREAALGPDHPDVAASLNGLALLYRAQRLETEAEVHFKRAAAVFEASLGPHHRDVGVALNNLARLYRDQYRYAEAEAHYQRAISIFQKALSHGHALVGTSLNNLAELYRTMNRHAEAERLMKRSLRIRTKDPGVDHPDYARSLNNLAVLYGERGRYAKAQRLYKQAIPILEKRLGEGHPFMATVLSNFAGLHKAEGRYDEAVPLYARALAIREERLGSDHPDVGQSLASLGETYWLQGRTSDAEPLFQRALAMSKADIKEMTILFGTNRGPDGTSAKRLSLGRGVLLAAQGLVMDLEARRVEGVLKTLTSEDRFHIRRIEPTAGVPEPRPPAPKQAFVFVHGYNVGFEDALKRTAQIAFDLEFNGGCLLFTWPSRATLWGYWQDHRSADNAVRYLVEFLQTIAKEMPGTRFHFVAHSMGNNVLLSALERMALRAAPEPQLAIGEIILAHPDVDHERFEQLAESVRALGSGRTLYTNGNDWALWIAKLLWGEGRAGGVPAVVAGVDTVDISGLGGSLWNWGSTHSIYAANPIVFGDIAQLLASNKRQPPHERTSSFEQVKTERGVYWRYRAHMGR